MGGIGMHTPKGAWLAIWGNRAGTPNVGLGCLPARPIYGSSLRRFSISSCTLTAPSRRRLSPVTFSR